MAGLLSIATVVSLIVNGELITKYLYPVGSISISDPQHINTVERKSVSSLELIYIQFGDWFLSSVVLIISSLNGNRRSSTLFVKISLVF